MAAPERLDVIRGHVLVADDDLRNLDLMERLLVRDDHIVHTARSGDEVLAFMARRVPDLVLLDVMMPGRSGLEVCRILKNEAATRLVPVVLVTALRESDDKIRGLDAGADDFVTKPVVPSELRARVRSLLRLKRFTDELDSAESVIMSLALTIEARDVYTKGHCYRLAEYATALGSALGLPRGDLDVLRLSGVLHDIGKVGIPDSVLLKEGPLTDAEFAIMQRHTTIGDCLCGKLRSLRRVRPIVRHHHERCDGSGYPDGLSGDQIPVLAQIISIVDLFDAVTTTRSYRAARDAEAACRELEAEVDCGWRRADLVDTFTQLVRSGVVRVREFA